MTTVSNSASPLISMDNRNPLFIERDATPITLQEYTNYKWNKKSTLEKITFFAKTIFSLGHHSAEYKKHLEQRFTLRMSQLAERNNPATITINDKVKHRLSSAQVEVLNKKFKFNLAGVIHVEKDGYVSVKLPNKAFKNIFNHISQQKNNHFAHYAGSFNGAHITLAWADEGQKHKDFFKRLHGKIVVFDKAFYAQHNHIHKIDIESKQLTMIRKIAGLSPTLHDRRYNRHSIPFHMTVGQDPKSNNERFRRNWH